MKKSITESMIYGYMLNEKVIDLSTDKRVPEDTRNTINDIKKILLTVVNDIENSDEYKTLIKEFNKFSHPERSYKLSNIDIRSDYKNKKSYIIIQCINNKISERFYNFMDDENQTSLKELSSKAVKMLQNNKELLNFKCIDEISYGYKNTNQKLTSGWYIKIILNM